MYIIDIHNVKIALKNAYASSTDERILVDKIMELNEDTCPAMSLSQVEFNLIRRHLVKK